MLKEFKEFILRGNAIELAVGIIIGAAFTAIVNSIVNNLIVPLISLFTDSVNFSEMTLKVGNSKITYGIFINDLISFVLTGFVVFLIVKVINNLSKKEDEELPAPTELELLTEIRDSLQKQNKTITKRSKK